MRIIRVSIEIIEPTLGFVRRFRGAIVAAILLQTEIMLREHGDRVAIHHLTQERLNSHWLALSGAQQMGSCYQHTKH